MKLKWNLSLVLVSRRVLWQLSMAKYASTLSLLSIGSSHGLVSSTTSLRMLMLVPIQYSGALFVFQLLTTFFWNHVPVDHTHGLENSQFRGELHCSEITAKLLLNKKIRQKRPFAYLRYSMIIHVEMEEFILHTTEYGKLTIMFLPANHCPGAIM